MKRVTIRVPATTANLGPGFDAFGCALSLYTDVTFEETESGLEITGFFFRIFFWAAVRYFLLTTASNT